MEALIVIRSVETSFRLSSVFTSANNSSRAAIAFAGGRDGVLMIETARLTGQLALAVAKHHAILRIPKRATCVNAAVDVLGLRGKGRQGHRRRGGACLLWCMATGQCFGWKRGGRTNQGHTSQ